MKIFFKTLSAVLLLAAPFLIAPTLSLAEANPYKIGGYCLGEGDCECGDLVRNPKRVERILPERGYCTAQHECYSGELYLPTKLFLCSPEAKKHRKYLDERYAQREERWQREEREIAAEKAREAERIRQERISRMQRSCDRFYVGQALPFSAIYGSRTVTGINRSQGLVSFHSSNGGSYEYEYECIQIK